LAKDRSHLVPDTKAAPDNCPAPSFRPDVFELNPPRLLASVCSECETRTFPPREICPRCASASLEEKARLSTLGEVYTFTIVRQAPPGLTIPYVLAYVDLPADEVRVMARIVGSEPEEVEVGDAVELAAAAAEPAREEPASMFVFVRSHPTSKLVTEEN
jgi:uncharacterized OB-fold protein